MASMYVGSRAGGVAKEVLFYGQICKFYNVIRVCTVYIYDVIVREQLGNPCYKNGRVIKPLFMPFSTTCPLINL